ncbi:unnamed protein product, partial [Ixodes hexagonus]
ETVIRRCFAGNTFNGVVCICNQTAVDLCCDDCDTSEDPREKTGGSTIERFYHLGWSSVPGPTELKLSCGMADHTNIGISPCCAVLECDREWLVNYTRRENASLQREPNSRVTLATNATLCPTCKDRLLQSRSDKNMDKMTLCTIRFSDRQVQEICLRDVLTVCYNLRVNLSKSNVKSFHPICLDVTATPEDAQFRTFPSHFADIANASMFTSGYCVFSNDSIFQISRNPTKDCTTSSECLNETSHFFYESSSSVYENAVNELIMIELYLSFVTGAASATGLILTVVVFFLDRSSRSCFAKCTFLLATTLLLGQVIGYVLICLTASYLDHEIDMVLDILDLLILYYSQSFFYWLSVLSYDIWRTLRSLQVHSGGWKRLTIYSTLSWGGAAVQFGVAFIIFRTTEATRDSDEEWSLQAFLGSQSRKLTTCISPVFLFLVNTFFYLHTVVVIRKTKNGSGLTVTRNRENESSLRLFVKLGFIMCITGVVRLVIALQQTIPGIQEDSLGNLVLHCIICLTIAIGGMPGVYLFFGLNGHTRLYSIIREWRARRYLKSSVQPTITEAVSRA